jgi:hypothetical protein
MFLFLLISIFSFASANNLTGVTSFTFKSCGDTTDLCNNLVLSVDPKLPQDNYSLYLGCDLNTLVTGGTSVYSITFNGIPFSPTTNDLCTEINSSNTTCPLNVGYYYSKSDGQIPTGISGKVVIKNQWYDISNNRILCMEFTIKTT